MNSEYSNNINTCMKTTFLSYRTYCIHSIIEELRKLESNRNILNTLDELLQNKNDGIVFPDVEMKKEFFTTAENIFSSSPVIRAKREEGLRILSILLQQQVEIYWYRNQPAYKTEKDIIDDDSLIDLSLNNLPLKIFFKIKIEKAGFFPRLIKYMKKKFSISRNNPGSNTVGMKTTLCRIETVSLLNELSCKITDLSGKQSSNIHINSILRSIDHQEHLSQLGYFAPVKSSHSTGYAVDIEKKWYRENDTVVFNTIHEVIYQYFEKGIINIIDEGDVWHICMNPEYITAYRKSALNWSVNNKQD